MWSNAVVIADPAEYLIEYRGRGAPICAGQVIPLERVHKGLRHPVRLRTVGRCRNRRESEPLGGAHGVERRADAPVIREELHRVCGPRIPKRVAATAANRACTSDARYVRGTATVAIASRSWQSRMKPSSTSSPFQHAISSVSLHRRSFELPRTTRPVCTRSLRRRPGRGRYQFSSITRRTRLRLYAVSNARLTIAVTRR